MSTSESELREVLIAMKIPIKPDYNTQSDIAFLYDYIDCVENMADENYRIIEPAASAEPVACVANCYTADGMPCQITEYLPAGTKLYAHPPAPQWQPIESAPKDGTNVLLVNCKGNIAAGLWQGDKLNGGWWLRGGNKPDTFFNFHHGPTHWMPLPAAPGREG